MRLEPRYPRLDVASGSRWDAALTAGAGLFLILALYLLLPWLPR